MKNNLVCSPIGKLCKENSSNIIFGKIKNNHILKKKYNLKEIDKTFSKKERLKELKFLKVFYEKKIKSLVYFLNDYHGTSYDRRFWEIIVGPFLNKLIYISRERWLTVKKNIKNTKINECSTVYFDKKNMVPINYEDFYYLFSKDELNCFLYFKAYKTLFSAQKIKIRYKKIKIVRSYLKIKNQKSILIKIYEKIFSLKKKNQKYLFFDHYIKKNFYFLLSLRLFNLPFRYFEFNYSIDQIKKKRVLSNLKFDNKPKSQFDIYFDQIFFYLLPMSYLENFKKINDYSINLKLNPKIIFTSLAHTSNDTFKIWSANQISKGSKLVTSDHGLILEKCLNFYNTKIYDFYIRWMKSDEKNYIQLPPNILLKKLKKQKNNSNKILVILTTRYFYKRNFYHKNGNDIDEYEFIKKQIYMLFKDNIHNFYFRIHPSSEMKNELEDLIELDFGKDKIDNETIFENTFKKYKLFIDTNFETTFLQTLYHDVPTLLLINYDFIDLNNDIKKLIKEMKKNNMIINNFHKSKKFIHNIIKDPQIWWNSKKTIQIKKKYLELCGIKTNDNFSLWFNFFRKI